MKRTILAALVAACATAAIFSLRPAEATPPVAQVARVAAPGVPLMGIGVVRQLGTLVNAATLDAASSTFSVDSIAGYHVISLTFDLTRSAATQIAMSCTQSNDSGTTNAELQDCHSTNGVCDLDDASMTKTVAGNKTWNYRIDIKGMSGQVDCTVTDTNGGSSDVLTVTGEMGT